MAHKIFWLAVQGIVETRNQSLILQDTRRFLLYELQLLMIALRLYEQERRLILHLILLLNDLRIQQCFL